MIDEDEDDEDVEEPDNPTESSSSQPVKDESTKRKTSGQRSSKKQTAADDRSGFNFTETVTKSYTILQLKYNFSVEGKLSSFLEHASLKLFSNSRPSETKIEKFCQEFARL